MLIISIISHVLQPVVLKTVNVFGFDLYWLCVYDLKYCGKVFGHEIFKTQIGSLFTHSLTLSSFLIMRILLVWSFVIWMWRKCDRLINSYWIVRIQLNEPFLSKSSCFLVNFVHLHFTTPHMIWECMIGFLEKKVKIFRKSERLQNELFFQSIHDCINVPVSHVTGTVVLLTRTVVPTVEKYDCSRCEISLMYKHLPNKSNHAQYGIVVKLHLEMKFFKN